MGSRKAKTPAWPVDTEAAVARSRGRIPSLVAELDADIAPGGWPLGAWVAGPASGIDAAEAALARLCDGARTLLFFSDGVPALCAQMMAQLAGWNIPGAADPSQRRRPRTRFFDTADPHTLAGALTADHLAATRFVLIDPSASRVVAGQAGALLLALEAAGLEDLARYVACASPATGAAWSLLHAKVPQLERLPPGVASTQGCLMTPGLMPALARGLDAHAILRAAQAQWMALRDRSIHSPIAQEAARMAALIAHGPLAGIVVRPFADRLGRLADWLAAVWSEVLKPDAHPIPAHALHGSLPLPGRTAGPTLVIHLTLEPGGAAVTPIGRIGAEAQADLVAAAEQSARAGGHLVRTIHIPRLDEATIGGLLMQLLLEAILCDRLLKG